MAHTFIKICVAWGGFEAKICIVIYFMKRNILNLYKIIYQM